MNQTGYVCMRHPNSGEPLRKWLDNQKVALHAHRLPIDRRAALADLDPAWCAPKPATQLAGAPIDPANVGEASSSSLRVVDEQSSATGPRPHSRQCV